ncbi:MAG: hypothetical protein ACPGXK_04175 [Phycisphaerae bacterium]
MFGQLFSARLKAAEKALRDGRLDEAYRLASSADLQSHKRGQAVLEQLAKPLFDRAREHFHADRFDEALQDLKHARLAGVMLDEIEELEGHIRTVADETLRKEASRQQQLQTARERIERGSLAAGREILENVSAGGSDAEALRKEVNDRAGDVARLVSQAESLVTQQNWSEAAQRVLRAKQLVSHDENISRLENTIVLAVLAAARQSFVDGHLKQARHQYASIRQLGEGMPEKQETKEMLRISVSAAEAVSRHDFAETALLIRQLMRYEASCSWLQGALAQCESAEDSVSDLRAGPLGLSQKSEGEVPFAKPIAEDRKPSPGSLDDTVFSPSGKALGLDDTVAIPGRADEAGLPEKMLLLVDGGGSFLLVRRSQVSVGRAACDRPADVAIMSDIAERHANITRVDDDYFLFASKELTVGGKTVRQALLQDGDRLVLGANAKFTFRLPSRKSATAVLDMSDTTKVPHDVRRVVIFDRLAVIGAGSSSHVVCRHASPALVLFERDGQLWVRRKSDGHVPGGAQPLEIGESLTVDGVNLVLQPWRDRPLGSSYV